MKLHEQFEKNYLVKFENSAKVMGSGDLEVLSTPSLVAFMEETCKLYINKFLNSDLGTVGTNININHIAPTKIEDEIKIIASITNMHKEKVITFTITAYNIKNNELIEIANATHTRVIINNEKFMSKLQ